MRSRWMGLRQAMSLMGPIAMLAGSVAGGVWLWLDHGDNMGAMRLGARIVALSAVAAVVWQARARQSRLRQALDAYAAREIARHGRRDPAQAVPARRLPRSGSAAVLP